MLSVLLLPDALTRPLDATYTRILQPPGAQVFDFRQPPGEPALAAPDSVSWRIFKNPVSLFIGGVTAVLLELAEPGVRTGVWEHSSFRRDPVRRLQRTGLAAMITVYGARSLAEQMIANVVRMHDRVSGETPAGDAYRANDPALLDWVQATAGFGFTMAYHRFVHPLTGQELDRAFAEAREAATLYGATGAPACLSELETLFESKRHHLEPSPIVFEFLGILGRAPALPGVLAPLQPVLMRAAVSLVPDWIRDRLGIRDGLKPWEFPLVRAAGAMADRLLLPNTPPVQACLRLGLPRNHLYR